MINIFERYTYVLDAELQQRACEYLALARRADEGELLATIFDEMPVFPERESALLNRLHSRRDKAQDKRTWVIGQSYDNKGREAERFKTLRKAAPPGAALANVNAPAAESSRAAAPSPPAPVPKDPPKREMSTGMDNMMGTTSASAADDIMASLADLDLSSGANAIQEQPLLPTSVAEQQPAAPTPPVLTPAAAVVANPISPNVTNGQEDMKRKATLGGVAPSLLTPLSAAPGIEKWLERLSYANEGVLYEDDFIQIGVKAEFHSALGRLALFFGNKVSTAITDVDMTIEYPNAVTQAGLDIRFHDAPVREIAGRAQIQELLHVECKDFFSEPPVLRMTYLAGSFTTLVLRLPVFLTRFIEGVNLEAGPFFERWKIIGGPPREAQQIFPIKLTKTGELDLVRNEKVTSGSRFTILQNVDPKPSNVSCYTPTRGAIADPAVGIRRCPASLQCWQSVSDATRGFNGGNTDTQGHSRSLGTKQRSQIVSNHNQEYERTGLCGDSADHVKASQRQYRCLVVVISGGEL